MPAGIGDWSCSSRYLMFLAAAGWSPDLPGRRSRAWKRSEQRDAGNATRHRRTRRFQCVFAVRESALPFSSSDAARRSATARWKADDVAVFITTSHLDHKTGQPSPHAGQNSDLFDYAHRGSVRHSSKRHIHIMVPWLKQAAVDVIKEARAVLWLFPTAMRRSSSSHRR